MAKIKFIKSFDEVDNIRSFVFESGDTSWLPGQYQTYVIDKAPGDEAAKTRFFTISAAPSEREFHISTRVTDSDFKQALNSLTPGDEIEAHGLEGDFTWDDDSSPLLVAGGIGVTPYRSMLVERNLTGQPINARLLYYGRDDNFAFRAEFDAIQSNHPELTIDYIVGQPITADSILEHYDSDKGQTVYLSGPEPMVESIGNELLSRGIALRQDWFPGYDDASY